MATIREISDAAGVSVATVSKVLNNKPGVNRETEARIREIARQLNYRPNLNARHLKRGRSSTLGVITEDLTVFNAPEIVDGIAATCEERGYHFILGNLRFNKRYGRNPLDQKESTALIQNMVDDMLSKQVDGIIYVGCHSHVMVPFSEDLDTKFVFAYCISSDPEIPYVVYDDEKASFEATELIINKGHRKIGMITGPDYSIHTARRTRGYQAALFDHGIPYDPRLTLTGDWTRDCGYRLCQELIAQSVTAIVAQNDLMAMGVIDYCNQNGIEVGKDLALIGFDNREVSSVTRPSLSTVALPLYEIGCKATNIMLDMLTGQELPESRKYMMECSIIERESSGGKLDESNDQT